MISRHLTLRCLNWRSTRFYVDMGESCSLKQRFRVGRNQISIWKHREKITCGWNVQLHNVLQS